jgi:EAL domain-containing protein (putative c-di-GMP-specific phosphodiesterase class I)
LHHPTPDRLTGRNAFDLIAEGSSATLRSHLWALGPGRRISLDEPSTMDGGRRILIQRDVASPDSFNVLICRQPRLLDLRADTTHEVLADRFRDAVMNERLRAALQPIVDISTGEVRHHEVLARFDDAASPADIIAAAERTGLICHLDYVMVDAAAYRLANDESPHRRLAVNVSGATLQRLDVVDELCAAIRGHGVADRRLSLEITESSRMVDLQTAAEGVCRLRRSGASVTLDDFGAGAASFGYLRMLDVDGLKFDGSFLHAGPREDRCLALLSAVASVCAVQNIQVVGEGVETERDRAVLRAAGVGLAQGYLFGRPTVDEAFFVRRPRSNRQAA